MSMAPRVFSHKARFFVLAGFLLIVFLTGGSSRADMSALLILRPLACLVLAYGLVTLSARDARRGAFPLVVIAGLAVLTALQLVPLPPSVWQALPGREPIAAIDRLLGLEGTWRPLTLDPAASLNALMALIVPAAAAVLAVQIDPEDRSRLLAVVLGIGAVSAAFGILQLLGPPDGPLYLYRVTNEGFAVGLFANRNHQALFLAMLVPLMYAWARQAPGTWRGIDHPRGRRGGVIFLALMILVPLVLITGSRAGLIALLMALCAVAALEVIALRADASRNPGRGKGGAPRWTRPLAGASLLIALAAVTVGLGRGLALERLIQTDPATDVRTFLRPAVFEIGQASFPWGTGIGSFDRVYRMFETDAHLMPRYVNHAHNDYLEIFMTGGLPGLILLIAGAICLAIAARRAYATMRHDPSSGVLSAASLAALLILAAGSVGDYPIRTPALASLAAILALWATRPPGDRLPDRAPPAD